MTVLRSVWAVTTATGLILAAASVRGTEDSITESLSRWSLGLGTGGTSLEVPLSQAQPICFKGCIFPDIAPSLFVDASIGLAVAHSVTLRASVSPAMQQELQLTACSTGAKSYCASDPPQRRWLEYRLAAEVHGTKQLASFAGLAVGGAAYPMPQDGGAQHCLIWDVRSGVEAERRVAARLEVSRANHGNPPWDWQGTEEGFVDRQIRLGVRLRLRRSN